MTTNDTDTERPLFRNKQRVRVKPTVHNSRMFYGIIQGMTQHPGMCCLNLDTKTLDPCPTNAAGEWAYMVASYAAPNAGAMWYTADGLEPMRREKKQ